MLTEKQKQAKQLLKQRLQAGFVIVSKASDALGAICLDCSAEFNEVTNMNAPWRWNKSKWLHEDGSGHKMVLVGRKTDTHGRY